jgi:hypothetical protein
MSNFINNNELKNIMMYDNNKLSNFCSYYFFAFLLICVITLFIPVTSKAQQTDPFCGNASDGRSRPRQMIEIAAYCVQFTPAIACQSESMRYSITAFTDLRGMTENNKITECVRQCGIAINTARSAGMTNEDINFFFSTNNTVRACYGRNNSIRASICVESGWFSCRRWLNFPRY